MIKFLILFICTIVIGSCSTENSQVNFAVGDAVQVIAEIINSDVTDSTLPAEAFSVQDNTQDIVSEETSIEDAVEDLETEITESADYPPGPYSLELFKVLPNMSFYDPWTLEWLELSSLYKHEEIKAFILVSSAGWCGPCIKEAAALIDVYEEYHEDGLEIIYTLGNTNQPLDVPFDTTIDKPLSAGYAADLGFMEGFQNIVQDLADKKLNYKMYADPNREFIEYTPGHAWPYSLLITTKDMGIRLVTEGYWSALMENKIIMALYNDTPDIPFGTE